MLVSFWSETDANIIKNKCVSKGEGKEGGANQEENDR